MQTPCTNIFFKRINPTQLKPPKCNTFFKKEDVTPLMEAVRHGHIQCAEHLLNAGADVNLKDSHGNTALMIAAQENRYSTTGAC
jgi:ankyrin repeat protein